MFVDRVQIHLSAGKGGNGVIAWRREKFIPKGGPAGGDGGNGGSVVLEADPQIPSLEHLRNRRILKAENGRSGEGNNRKGRNGESLAIPVPIGTLVKNPISGEVLFDFSSPSDTYRICQGGRGGKGNSHFKTSTHQAPYVCTEGTLGESIEVELELKLIADVGLVGMPNAGKSTLLNRLTYRKVKIAPYPFTTLHPNIGIFQKNSTEKLLLADIPGLIENAAENRGLGHDFLRHVERTNLLLFVIELAPFEERDPFAEFEMLREELSRYKKDLLQKPFLVVLNKIDQEETAPLIEAFRARYPFPRDTLFEISAKESIGLEPLQEKIRESFSPLLV